MPESCRLQPARDMRPAALEFFINGQPCKAYPGETVATALLACQVRGFRRSTSGTPRLPMCNMGVCHDCAVTIDGLESQRSCMVQVTVGMHVEVSDEA